MGDPRIDRSFLGDAAIRLGNALDVGGPVSPQFNSDERIIPVVLVADATDRGNVGQKGRRWARHLAIGGGQELIIRATAPLIIDGWSFWTTVAGTTTVSVYGASVGEPFAGVANATAVAVDAINTSQERVPILELAGAAGLLAGGQPIQFGTIAGAVAIEWRGFPCFLQEGQKIGFTSSVSACSGTLWGRFF